MEKGVPAAAQFRGKSLSFLEGTFSFGQAADMDSERGRNTSENREIGGKLFLYRGTGS